MTAAPKFTPGPWVTRGTTWDKLHIVRKGAGRQISESLAEIHPTAETDSGYADRDANARLIATAPDLYAALVMVRNVVGTDELRERIDAILARVDGAS